MNLILCFLCLIIVSCHHQTDTTKVRINYAALSEEDKFDFGMILYARNESGTEAGASVFPGTKAHDDDLLRRLDNDSNLSELKNGKWIFMGIGYKKDNGPVLYCAHENVTLAGREQEIDLVFSTHKCTGEKSSLVSGKDFRENFEFDYPVNPTQVTLCSKDTYDEYCLSSDDDDSNTMLNCINQCVVDGVTNRSGSHIVIAYYGRTTSGDVEPFDELNFDTSLSGELKQGSDLEDYENNLLIFGAINSFFPVSLYRYVIPSPSDDDGFENFNFPDESTSLADSSIKGSYLEEVLSSTNGIIGFQSLEHRSKIRIISGKELADEKGKTYNNCGEEDEDEVPCDRNHLIYCVDC